MNVDEMQDIDEKAYKEILAKLEDKHMAEIVEKSQEWEVIRRAAKQIRDLTQQQYNELDHADPNAKYKAMQCQVAIQFYDNFLNSVITRYKALGEEAYEYAAEMGWLQKMATWIKS